MKALRSFQLFGAICLTAFLCSGCATMNATVDPRTQALLFQEAGFNLAFYTLRGEPQPVIERTEKAICTAIKMLKTKNVREMVDVIIKYIESSPQFQARLGEEEYAPLIKSSVRLLSGLLDLNVEISDEQEQVRMALQKFLQGALEGIQELKVDTSQHELTRVKGRNQP